MPARVREPLATIREDRPVPDPCFSRESILHKIIHLVSNIRASFSEWGWRRRVFSFVVLFFFVLLGLLGVLLLRPVWFGWLPHNISTFASAHFASTNDIIHELMFSLIFGTAVVGMLAQLRKPSENIAGQLMALIAWLAWLLAAMLTNNWVPFILITIFGGLTLFATILHPNGLGIFNWFSVSRVNRVLLALVAVAAVPLLVFAATNIGLQTAGNQVGLRSGFTGFAGHQRPAIHGGGSAANQELSQDQPSNDSGGAATSDEKEEHDHAAIGHYKNGAALSFIIISLGLLASLRPKGWRLTAWVTGLLPALLGLSSLVFLGNSASLGLFWGLAAIAWGVVFIVAAELTRDRASKEARAL